MNSSNTSSKPKDDKLIGGKRASRNKKGKNSASRRMRSYYFLLVLIAVLLSILLIALPENPLQPEGIAKSHGDSVDTTENQPVMRNGVTQSQNVPPEDRTQVTEQPSKESRLRTGRNEADTSPAVESHPEETRSEEDSLPSETLSDENEKSLSGTVSPAQERVPEQTTGRITIIIDDVGNNLQQLESFLMFPGPLTFAVLPHRPFTPEAVRRIQATGKKMILHQPMEPIGDADPGVGAIYVGMSRREIFTILDDNFAQVPGALGMNNHMGSKVTADQETMEIIFDYLHQKGLSFIDSVTSGETVASEVASRTNVSFTKRNSMFLDNESDEQAIHEALETGLETAKSTGRAVMIGHVMSSELADALLTIYPDILEEGYRVEDVYSLLTAQGVTVASDTNSLEFGAGKGN